MVFVFWSRLVCVDWPFRFQPLEEIQKQFMTEFNYVEEAKNMQLVHDNVMEVFSNEVSVPLPIMELCRQVHVQTLAPIEACNCAG